MKTILIPDIHQNVDFAKNIISKEYKDGDYIVFMGDYFDSFDSDLTVDSTCEFLIQSKNNLRCDFLIGNHDLCYYESIFSSKNYPNKPTFYNCSGFSRNKAKNISKFFGKNKYRFFQDLMLYVEVEGYVVSHAGFHPSHFHPYKSISENLMIWKKKMDFLLQDIYGRNFNIIGLAGENRGGKTGYIGGPLWLDYYTEFINIEDMPQIVGHTTGIKTIEAIKRNNNFCIDCCQTVYMIIDNESKLMTIKNIFNEVIYEQFIDKTPI